MPVKVKRFKFGVHADIENKGPNRVFDNPAEAISFYNKMIKNFRKKKPACPGISVTHINSSLVYKTKDPEDIREKEAGIFTK